MTEESKTESLIEQYLEALDLSNSVDEEEADEASIDLANLAEELEDLKPMITAKVKWRDGQTTETQGVLTALRGDKVYFECSLGPVDGDASTMAAG